MVDGQLRHDRIAKQIGPVTTRGKRLPRKIEDDAREIVAAATVTNANPERVLTIGEFAERVYFPHIEQYKRPSTLKGYRDMWENHVKARCAGDWLKDVRTFHVQRWLDSIASPGTFSRNTLKHIKTFVSAVFKLAKQQGYYSGENPVRDTATSPKATAPQETYAYDLSEIQRMLSVMPEPAATIFAVAALTGLRRSELQGLRWEDYEDGLIRVSRAIWEGHENEPHDWTQQRRGPGHHAGCRTLGVSPDALRESAKRSDVSQPERKACVPEQRSRSAYPPRVEAVRILRQGRRRAHESYPRFQIG